MTADNRIYVACLASYNNGVLHGRWIDASSDVDEMQEQVNAMLRASKFPNVTVDCPECEVGRRGMGCVEGKSFTGYYECKTCGGYGKLASAEEYAIHDHEGPALEGIGEYTSLVTIAARIEAAELAEDELGEDGPEIVAAYWDHVGGRPDDAKEAVETARDAYIGQYRNATEWAENFLEDTGMLSELPEWARNYFDFEAYGRDAVYGGDIFEANGYWFNNH